MHARKVGEGNGSDRDGHWKWIRRLTGNEVRRDGRRVATPTSRAGGALSKTGESPLTEIEWFSADFDHPKLQLHMGT